MFDENNKTLYETTIDFSLDSALRYLRTNRSGSDTDKAMEGDELTAFRFFLANNTVLNSLQIDSSWITT
jgi:hypothetical protein